MSSDYRNTSHTKQHIIGLPSHRALRFLDAMPLPRACDDRLTHDCDALRVAVLAISRPLDDETIIVASDIDGFGIGLIALRHTLTSVESIDAVRRTLSQPSIFGAAAPIAAVTVLTVLREGFSNPPADAVHLLRQQLDTSQVSLDHWFCIDNMLRSVDVETLVVAPH